MFVRLPWHPYCDGIILLNLSRYLQPDTNISVELAICWRFIDD